MPTSECGVSCHAWCRFGVGLCSGQSGVGSGVYVHDALAVSLSRN